MTNRYDTYDERGNKNHYVQNKGLSQVQFKDLMLGWFTQDREGIWEPIPANTAWETSPYVRYWHESRP